MDETVSTALLDILELIARIDCQAKPLGREAFLTDSNALDATAYRLLAIGEAAKAIPDTVRARHPQIPWTRITGLRNILAHRYFGREMRSSGKRSSRGCRPWPWLAAWSLATRVRHDRAWRAIVPERLVR